jgi:hypothetical protein
LGQVLTFRCCCGCCGVLASLLESSFGWLEEEYRKAGIPIADPITVEEEGEFATGDEAEAGRMGKMVVAGVVVVVIDVDVVPSAMEGSVRAELNEHKTSQVILVA